MLIMEKEPEYSVVDEKEMTLEKWSETLRFLVELETDGLAADLLSSSADQQKNSLEKKTK